MHSYLVVYQVQNLGSKRGNAAGVVVLALQRPSCPETVVPREERHLGPSAFEEREQELRCLLGQLEIRQVAAVELDEARVGDLAFQVPGDL